MGLYSHSLGCGREKAVPVRPAIAYLGKMGNAGDRLDIEGLLPESVLWPASSTWALDAYQTGWVQCSAPCFQPRPVFMARNIVCMRAAWAQGLHLFLLGVLSW